MRPQIYGMRPPRLFARAMLSRKSILDSTLLASCWLTRHHFGSRLGPKPFGNPLASAHRAYLRYMAAASATTFTTSAGASVQVDLVIMDCDGIIFDSNNIKTAAYREAIAAIDGAELAERFVQEVHLFDVSVARRIKFEIYFSELAPRPEGERAAFVDRAFVTYSEAVERAYENLTAVKAALDLASRVPTIVVSGGDHQELQRVFSFHKITANFVEVRGSGEGGASKPYHVQEIMAKREGAAVDRSIFIGDGWTDFKTAHQFGIHFVFLEEMSDWHRWKEQTAGADPQSMTVCATWADITSHLSDV